MSNWARFPLEQLELRGDSVRGPQGGDPRGETSERGPQCGDPRGETLVRGPQCGDPCGETWCGAGLARQTGK